MDKRQIGIFSGSFNPVHVGHLILANYMREFTYLDEVWFVVTPHNPLKGTAGLLDDQLRLEMVRLALHDFENMRVSDIEFRLPRPSYTVDTLAALEREYPDYEFTLIIGADNWNLFKRWRSSEIILEKYRLLIYPRVGVPVDIPIELEQSVRVVPAPVVEISSTFIRECIREGKNPRAFLPPEVHEYITKKGLYRTVP